MNFVAEQTDQAELVARLADNLFRVRQKIAEACARAGRDPGEVAIVAVTKYVDLPVIRALVAAGAGELGENRVQQLVARAAALGSRIEKWREPRELGQTPAPTVPRWHMVGHLQRNKVRMLLPQVRVLHALDSLRLAQEVQRVAELLDVQVDAFIEVNVSGEASKFGVPPAELSGLAEAVQRHSRIILRGLMTMAPLSPDPQRVRPVFAQLRELLRGLQRAGVVGPQCTHLSMGMSQDYAVAVEEGATFVRIGTALYEGLPIAPQ
jgi:pyridoxal phosphate enzyme (YggS family)